MPALSEYIIDSENPRRTSDETILLSLKLTMSHNDHDHFHYGCFGRPSRRSPNVAGNSNVNSNNNTARRGFFSSGGRTVLPPLHLPFRTSRSPGLFPVACPGNTHINHCFHTAPDPNYVANQYGQQDPTHPRADYNIPVYDQSGWPANTCESSPSAMFYVVSNRPDLPVATQHPSQVNQFPNDPRYPQNTSYPSSAPRTSPPIPTGPYDSRTLSSAHQGQFYPQGGETATSMMPGTHIRSPSSAGYPAQYPYGAQPQAAYYATNQDPRVMPPTIPNMPYDPSGGATIPRRTSLSVDRTVPSRMSAHGLPPYARAPPPMPSSYDQESIVEPTIKKKRKRAGKSFALCPTRPVLISVARCGAVEGPERNL